MLLVFEILLGLGANGRIVLSSLCTIRTDVEVAYGKKADAGDKEGLFRVFCVHTLMLMEERLMLGIRVVRGGSQEARPLSLGLQTSSPRRLFFSSCF